MPPAQANEVEDDCYKFLTNHLAVMGGVVIGFGFRIFKPVASSSQVCIVAKGKRPNRE